MARLRVVQAVDGVLPPEVAAGPSDAAWSNPRDTPEHADTLRRCRWFAAGRRWSREHGHSWNGWQRLLEPEVRAGMRVEARVPTMPPLVTTQGEPD